MSEHSDDGFDRWMREEAQGDMLRNVCERTGDGCDWSREINDDGMLECKTCGKVVDE